LALWVCHLAWLVPVLGLTEHPHYPTDRYDLAAGILWSIPASFGLFALWNKGGRRVAAIAAIGVVAIAFGVLSRHQIGIWKNSVALCRHLIAHVDNDPLRTGFYWRLGNVYREMGDYQNAADCFKQTLQLDPGMGAAHEQLGQVLYRQGKIEDAVAHYTEALRLSPDDFNAHHNLGAALAVQGKMAEAAAQFAEAVRINPDSVNAHHSLARALTALGRLDDARIHDAEAQRLETRRPTNAR
jgi:tetratricopeptide (TPR) repeat protein